MDELTKEYQEYLEVLPIFRKHFPELEQKALQNLARRFVAEKQSSLWESWNHQEQQKRLTRLRSQLRQTAETLLKVHHSILEEIAGNLTLPLVVLDGTYDRKTCEKEVFDFAPSSAESNAAFGVLEGLMSLSENLEKAIKYTQDELPQGIPVRNRNIEAWRVVETLVERLRNHSVEMNVPKKMNGSGPLRRILIDLFEHYKINASVDAAFNGWIKHIDRKRDFLDLLPI